VLKSGRGEAEAKAELRGNPSYLLAARFLSANQISVDLFQRVKYPSRIACGSDF